MYCHDTKHRWDELEVPKGENAKKLASQVLLSDLAMVDRQAYLGYERGEQLEVDDDFHHLQMLQREEQEEDPRSRKHQCGSSADFEEVISLINIVFRIIAEFRRHLKSRATHDKIYRVINEQQQGGCISPIHQERLESRPGILVGF